MKRPVLLLQTVYFHDSDREEALRLGADLYERLTRPIDDPLAHGPGIPVLVGVQADAVDLEAADTVMLIPVLGKVTRGLMGDHVLNRLKQWHAALGPGHVVPVPVAANWREDEGKLPGKNLLTMLYSKGDARRVTLDEIVLAALRLWKPDNVQLFISHAKADLAATNEAAKKIHEFVTTDTTGKAFFDANDLRPGESLGDQVDTSAARGVLISVRGDAYSSRVWCQREVLVAKLNGMPTLSVEVLRRGELRSSPYGGNSPSMVWDGNPSPIVSQAMVEALRTEFFRREAVRIIEAANLPKDVAVVARPPELLDLAQGPLRSDHAQLVLHPDPELSVLERRVLKAARPRLHLATPTTAFRRLLSRRDECADVASPLEGMQVAMSLSVTPDADKGAGFTHHHVVDATVCIARAIISAGAAIAYGGDFRTGGKAFTPLLAQLVQTYNQTASKRAHDLHSYLAAIIRLEDTRDDLPLALHHLGISPELAQEALLPNPALPGAPPNALYFSDMRRVMEQHVAARVVLGGQADPKIEKDGEGYGGRYPGLVEEAWRSMQKGNPLYVAGGFGGAAGLVADLLEGKETPPQLRDATWMSHEFYAQTAAKLDAHPERTHLGLPERMADLVGEIRKHAEALLKDDAASTAWNGLSVAENKTLFHTRDAVTLSALILKGLLRIARRQGEGKLQIELVHDSLTAADNLDAVAIAFLEGVPLGGAAAAIDRATGGSATQALATGQTLVSVQDSLIDADWLFMASLGKIGDAGDLLGRVEGAARDTAEVAGRHGFQRVGVISFGGNIISEIEGVAKAMVRGFSSVAERPAVVWYETDDGRFDRLREALKKDDKVSLTSRRSVVRITAEASPREPLFLTVRLEGDQLSATWLSPSSAAAVPTHTRTFPAAELSALSEGSGVRKRATPGLQALEERGAKLTRLLFGDHAEEILAACKDSRLIVVHDTAASKVPFEMLFAAPGLRPAIESGITRRLSVSGLAFERQFVRPSKKGKLKVLLIGNPTEDLPGADAEAKAVRAILKTQSADLDFEEFWEKDATVENVQSALQRADILHYCGHAYFDGPGLGESGLLLAGRVPFTGEDLKKIESLPRAAFVNACEAGRVRGAPDTNAAAFAELFLRSGIEAYLGAYWEVSDAAAHLFAQTVYTQLALGDTLEQAVLAGRKVLFDEHEPDWANYLLYGGGNFRLATQTHQ